MPANPKNKSANQRLAAWINQGLKRQHWSARRVTQMALLMALGVMVAALYLVQSSQIVTSTRQVQLHARRTGRLAARQTPIWR